MLGVVDPFFLGRISETCRGSDTSDMPSPEKREIGWDEMLVVPPTTPFRDAWNPDISLLGVAAVVVDTNMIRDGGRDMRRFGTGVGCPEAIKVQFDVPILSRSNK